MFKTLTHHVNPNHDVNPNPCCLPCLQVVTPLPGGPADVAGIRAGDILFEVAGQPTAGLSLYEASDLLLGDVGSEVRQRQILLH